MVDSVFSSYPVQQTVVDDLLVSIGGSRLFWTPRTDTDGICRLEKTHERLFPASVSPTFIPLRKLFLPHREEVWTYRSESFRVAEVPNLLRL